MGVFEFVAEVTDKTFNLFGRVDDTWRITGALVGGSGSEVNEIYDGGDLRKLDEVGRVASGLFKEFYTGELEEIGQGREGR